jgi:hypothetical protein
MSRWAKTHDLAVRTGTYQGADGKEKGRYENIGHVLRGDDNEKLLLLKRTFNPAGVPNPDGRDTVILSMFEVRDRAANGNTAAENAAITASEGGAPAQRPARPAATDDFNDDVPF